MKADNDQPDEFAEIKASPQAACSSQGTGDGIGATTCIILAFYIGGEW
jgi:hypothetical protein